MKYLYLLLFLILNNFIHTGYFPEDIIYAHPEDHIDRETLIYKALVRKNNKLLLDLLEQGEDPNQECHPYEHREYHGYPLSVALESGNLEAFEMLLKYGSKHLDDTFLKAVKRFKINAVLYLINKNITLNFQDNAGNNALHGAALRQEYPLFVIKLLMLYGFDPFLKNKENKSAYDINPKLIGQIKLEIEQEFNQLEKSLKDIFPGDLKNIILSYQFSDFQLQIFDKLFKTKIKKERSFFANLFNF